MKFMYILPRSLSESKFIFKVLRDKEFPFAIHALTKRAWRVFLIVIAFMDFEEKQTVPLAFVNFNNRIFFFYFNNRRPLAHSVAYIEKFPII